MTKIKKEETDGELGNYFYFQASQQPNAVDLNDQTFRSDKFDVILPPPPPSPPPPSLPSSPQIKKKTQNFFFHILNCLSELKYIRCTCVIAERTTGVSVYPSVSSLVFETTHSANRKLFLRSCKPNLKAPIGELKKTEREREKERERGGEE